MKRVQGKQVALMWPSVGEGTSPLQEQAAGPRHLLPKMFLEMFLLCVRIRKWSSILGTWCALQTASSLWSSGLGAFESIMLVEETWWELGPVQLPTGACEHVVTHWVGFSGVSEGAARRKAWRPC